MRFVIITGLSGAGKTEAVRCLEDLGFFCVDNLPPVLISKFAELCYQTGGKIDKIALVIDIRGGEFFNELLSSLDELENEGISMEILFLEASDEALVKRFKESRRRHPWHRRTGSLKGLRREGTVEGNKAEGGLYNGHHQLKAETVEGGIGQRVPGEEKRKGSLFR